jgi:hypothetical protein
MGGQAVMNLTTLLNKLLEIEQSIGIDPAPILRQKMQDAEEYLLEIQKQRGVGIEPARWRPAA